MPLRAFGRQTAECNRGTRACLSSVSPALADAFASEAFCSPKRKTSTCDAHLCIGTPYYCMDFTFCSACWLKERSWYRSHAHCDCTFHIGVHQTLAVCEGSDRWHETSIVSWCAWNPLVWTSQISIANGWFRMDGSAMGDAIRDTDVGLEVHVLDWADDAVLEPTLQGQRQERSQPCYTLLFRQPHRQCSYQLPVAPFNGMNVCPRM